MNGQQRHEDGRAISLGFDGPWLFCSEVAFTISGVVATRHLCPALYSTSSMKISKYNNTIIKILGAIFIVFGLFKILSGLKSTWFCLKYSFYPSNSITFPEIVKFTGITLFLNLVLPAFAIYAGIGLLRHKKRGWIFSVIVCFIVFIVSAIGTITFIMASYHFRGIPMIAITEGTVVGTYSMIPTYIQCLASFIIGITLTRKFIKESFFIDTLKYNNGVEQT